MAGEGRFCLAKAIGAKVNKWNIDFDKDIRLW
jgi:hypothetical protein